VAIVDVLLFILLYRGDIFQQQDQTQMSTMEQMKQASSPLVKGIPEMLFL
jgi:hypothetical protein